MTISAVGRISSPKSPISTMNSAYLNGVTLVGARPEWSKMRPTPGCENTPPKNNETLVRLIPLDRYVGRGGLPVRFWRRRPAPTCSPRYAQRVRHLHHRFPGACSFHFSEAAERAGPAHRARAAALRPVFGARCGAPLERRQSGHLAAAPAEPRPKPVAEAEPAERWKGIAEQGSRRGAGLDAIVARTRASIPSISLPAGARLRDDRDGLRPRRPAHPRRTCCRARSTMASRPLSAIAKRARRSRAASSRSTRPTSSAPKCKGTYRARDGALRLAAGLGHSRPFGNVIDGSPDKVTDVTDVWTFARDLSRAIPTGNWWRPKPGSKWHGDGPRLAEALDRPRLALCCLSRRGRGRRGAPRAPAASPHQHQHL